MTDKQDNTIKFPEPVKPTPDTESAITQAEKDLPIGTTVTSKEVIAYED
jgi:hypothetical protein